MKSKRSTKEVKFFSSVKNKMILLLTVSTVTLVSIFGVNTYNNKKKNLIASQSKVKDQIIRRLQLFTFDPLLIEDKNYLEKILELEIQNENINAIILRKNNTDFVIGKIKLNDRQIVNYDPLDIYDILRDKSNIKTDCALENEGTELAHINIYFSDKSINTELNSIIINIVFEILLLEITIIIFLIFTLRRLIIEPVNKIKSGIKNILLENSGERIEVIGNDEISDLILLVNYLNSNINKQKENSESNVAKYISIFQNVEIGIALIKKGRIIECNLQLIETYGISKDAMLGKSLIELIPGEDSGMEIVSNQLLEMENDPDKKPLDFIIERCNSGGRIIDLEIKIARISYQNKVWLLATVKDITEKRRIEKEIRVKEERYRTLFENVPDIVFNVSFDGEIFISLNPAFEKITSWRCEEWIGKPFYTIIHSEDIKKVEDIIEKIKAGEHAPICELRFLTKKGVYLTGEFLTSPHWKDGNIIGFFGVARDITEKIELEKETKRDYEFIKNIINHMGDPLFVKDDQHRLIFVNDAFSDVTGLPHTELIGKTEFDFLPKEEAELSWKRDDLVYSIGISDENEESFTDINQNKYTVLSKKSTFTDLDSNVYLISLLRDITERKIAEDNLKASLHEKEILLKEIHHRVKNNLQIISSLLHIQATYVKDAESLKLFKNSQTRVRSMALIHEKLYQSKNLARINFGGYVHDIATHLFRIYHVNINEVALRIEVPKDTYLSVDTAIPCGLIINEILTNSLKYGFNHKKNGEVFVIFGTDKNNYKLSIGDDGDKIPENIDFKNVKTLGLQLVSILANQLKGSLEMRFNEKKEFIISFPAI